MEDNKTITTKDVENTVLKEPEAKTTLSVTTYDPDDYIEEYYLYDDMFYYDEKCFSCKYWHGYECGAPNGPCSYESY